MKLISIQIALFPKTHIVRPDFIMNKVNEETGNLFDTMPTIINLPQGAPVDIPIVQSKSSNGFYELNVSRGRVDLILNFDYKVDLKPSDHYKEQRNTISKYYKTVKKEMELIRVGAIFTLFEKNEQNVKKIYETFLKQNCPNGSIEATIRTNKKTKHNNISYNNICLIQSAILHVGNENINGIIFQTDTNNVPDENHVLVEKEIERVILEGSKCLLCEKIEEII